MNHTLSNSMAPTTKSASRLTCGLLVLLAVSVPLAHAQGQRFETWVAANGNDSNPCSRNNPCATFQGALARTTAGGEVHPVDTADYGPVNITFPVTIDGAGSGASIGSAANRNGCGQPAAVCVATGGGTVILRNLSVSTSVNSGAGIVINGPASPTAVYLEKLFLDVPESWGIVVTGDVAVKVIDTEIRDCLAGFSLGPRPGSAVLDNVRITGNGPNASLNGILCNGCGNANVRNVTVSEMGEAVTAVNGFVSVEGSLLINNNVAISSEGQSYVAISNNSIYGNGTGLNPNGGAIDSFGNNRVFSNTTNGPIPHLASANIE